MYIILQMTPFIGKSNAAKEQVSIIRSGIERLSSTVNQLLVSTYSRNIITRNCQYII